MHEDGDAGRVYAGRAETGGAATETSGGTSRRGFLTTAAGLASALAGAGWVATAGTHPAQAAQPEAGGTTGPEARTIDARLLGERWRMAIDGADAGYVDAFGGGVISGEVVEEQPGTGPVGKHLAGFRVGDVTVEVGLGAPSPLFQWVTAQLSGSATGRDVQVVATDARGVHRSSAFFHNSLITRVTLPACDASSKDVGRLSVRCSPEFGQYRSDAGTSPPARQQKMWQAHNFQLDVPGLDCSRVHRIEPITIEQAVQEDPVGERRGGREVGVPKVSNLVVTVDASTAATWIEWHDDFAVRGNSGREAERTGTLTLLASDGKSALATIGFAGLGIVQVTTASDTPTSNERRVTASLYFEAVRLQFAAGSGPKGAMAGGPTC